MNTKLKLISIRLYEDDVEFLKQEYPETGYQSVVRRIIRKAVEERRRAGKSISIEGEHDGRN